MKHFIFLTILLVAGLTVAPIPQIKSQKPILFIFYADDSDCELSWMVFDLKCDINEKDDRADLLF